MRATLLNIWKLLISIEFLFLGLFFLKGDLFIYFLQIKLKIWILSPLWCWSVLFHDFFQVELNVNFVAGVPEWWICQGWSKSKICTCGWISLVHLFPIPSCSQHSIGVGCSCEFSFLAFLISFVALYAGSMEMGACFPFLLQLGILYISLQALIEGLLFVFQSNILSSIIKLH